jgi:hypothetical protein
LSFGIVTYVENCNARADSLRPRVWIIGCSLYGVTLMARHLQIFRLFRFYVVRGILAARRRGGIVHYLRGLALLFSGEINTEIAHAVDKHVVQKEGSKSSVSFRRAAAHGLYRRAESPPQFDLASSPTIRSDMN